MTSVISHTGRVLIGPCPDFADVCENCGRIYGTHVGTRCPVDVDSHFKPADPVAQEFEVAA